jgi:hypothetical protein
MKKTDIYTKAIFSYKEEWNCVIFRKVDRTGDHYVKENKLWSKTNMTCFLSYTEHRFHKNDMRLERGLFGKKEREQ